MLDKSSPANPEALNEYKDLDWTFIGHTGASFRSHEVVLKSDKHMVVKPRIAFLAIYVLAILGSILFSAYFYPRLDELLDTWPIFQQIFVVILIIVFFFGGLYSLIYNLRNYKYLSKQRNSFMVLNKPQCKLSDIKAIQLLYTRAKSRGISKDSTANVNAYDYQLNFVLTDHQRIHIISQGGLKGIQQDAIKISEFLQVPVLDGINYDYINSKYIPEHLH